MEASNSEHCAFACHNTNYGVKAQNKDGSTAADYYAAARSWNIPLRVDVEGIATNNLMTTATQASSTNHATYRMSVSTFTRVPSRIVMVGMRFRKRSSTRSADWAMLSEMPFRN